MNQDLPTAIIELVSEHYPITYSTYNFESIPLKKGQATSNWF
jgi:hypothetical protein